jgi:DNA polymerase I-like protein with 3'-5' exonuclease and polymerase domains
MQGLDIETTALDPTEGELALVQIRDGDFVDIYRPTDPDVLPHLRSLTDPVAHNAPFERSWIKHRYEHDLGVIHDTMVMSNVLYGGTDASRSPRFSHSLEAVAKRELGVELDKTEQTAAWDGPLTDEMLRDEEPLIDKWLAWKRVEKFRSTYGESLRKKLVGGRIHGRFKQFGTATGRFSSADPNLQNIPKDAAIRGMFWSGSDDRVLIKADYSGIELWLAAVLWVEHLMMKLLRDGVNLHTATAAALYGSYGGLRPDRLPEGRVNPGAACRNRGT